MTGQGHTHWGARPSHWGAKPSQSEWVFPHKRASLQTEILLCVISCSGGWFQMIPQVKKPDREVLGWSGLRLWGRLDILPNSLKMAAYGRQINIQFSGKNYGGHSCSQHANCSWPQNLRHLWHCVVWQNCTLKIGLLLSPAQGTVMIMLFNQLLEMLHLSSGWII